MFYIKLEDDMSLVITVRESIYRGDNLNQKIRYLVPFTVGEIDMLTAFVYLNYIRPDGTPDVVRLERLSEKYNESYYQYVFPVTCKLTKFPGVVCTWMQIYAGNPSNPIISKSGECLLHIEASKNMDDYFCDHQLTALYQLEKSLEGKADGLSYDKDNCELQLKSGDTLVGNTVVISADGPGDEDEPEWGDMEEDEESGGNTSGGSSNGSSDDTSGDGESGDSSGEDIFWEPM